MASKYVVAFEGLEPSYPAPEAGVLPVKRVGNVNLGELGEIRTLCLRVRTPLLFRLSYKPAKLGAP